MKKIIILCAALLVVLALATTAYGQNSSVQGYNDNAGTIQAQVQSGNDGTSPTTPAAVTEADSGALPFTGLDVALLAAAGGLLLLAGFGARRLTRAPETP
jgi:hypothetical protein